MNSLVDHMNIICRHMPIRNANPVPNRIGLETTRKRLLGIMKLQKIRDHVSMHRHCVPATPPLSTLRRGGLSRLNQRSMLR